MHRGMNLVVVAVALAVLVAALPGTRVEAARKPPPPPAPVADPAIAYTCAGSLMVMDADGSNQTTLLAASTKKAYNCSDPDWSPDGDWIVFAAAYPENGIYMVKRDGTGLCEVVTTSFTWAVHPQWSHDAKYILYCDRPSDGLAGDYDIFLAEATENSTVVVNLTNTPDDEEIWPTWAPRDDRFACQLYHGDSSPQGNREYDIAVYALDRADSTDPNDWSAGLSLNLSDVDDLLDYDCGHVDWAKTSDRVTFDAMPQDAVYGTEGDLFVIDFNDLENITITNVTNNPDVAEGQASWSPDDSRIVFTYGTLGIYVMDDDGSNLTRLVPNPRNTYLHDPAWKH